VALAQPDASFNFNPLILAPRRTIDASLHRAVSELFGCWDESALQIETSASEDEPALPPTATAPRTLTGRRSELLALPPGPTVLVQRRSVLLIAAAVVTVIGLSTAIAVTGGFKNNQIAATPLQQSQPQSAPIATSAEAPKSVVAASVKSNRSERREEKRNKQSEKTTSEAVAAATEPEQSSQAIKVVMQIENGRVLKASIANPKPGMDSYEALALRIARQRRYPATVTGGETVTISVKQ